MKSIFKVLSLATLLCLPGLAAADKGGIPNAAACNPGNASFCPERNTSSAANVPEISAAGLPAALGLAATVVLLIRERKRKR